jgi:hypothetical protein
MSINHSRPRQDRRNVGRSPVKRHARIPSVCTEAKSPTAKITRAQKAALIQNRRKDIQ